MAIPLPNLDDRSYAELRAQAQALIPNLYPDWTNHNASDPGVMLIELLAWLTEMLVFQINEIPEEHTVKFLKLLNGGDWKLTNSLDDAIRKTMRQLRQRYRAITPQDYEQAALHDWMLSEAAAKLGQAGKLKRVQCVPRRNLEATDLAVRNAPAPAHVSLVVVPEPVPGEVYPTPTGALLKELAGFFDARRILTAQQHFVGPSYVELSVGANFAVHEDAPLDDTPNDVRKQARNALIAFFHPLHGGPQGTGWPFGRTVYASEIYAVLESVSSVNYVEDVRLSVSPKDFDRLLMQGESVVGVKLDAHELVKLVIAPSGPRLVAYDVNGREYPERAEAA